MRGTSSSDPTASVGRTSRGTHFLWWALDIALLIAGLTCLLLTRAANHGHLDPIPTWIGPLLLAFSAVTTAILSVISVSRPDGGFARRSPDRQRGAPSPTSLAGSRGAIKWLVAAGSLFIASAVSLIISATCKDPVSAVFGAVFLSSLFTLATILIGLTIWLLVALAVQLTRGQSGPLHPAYPGGPEVPPEPYAYMQTKLGPPSAAMAVGAGCSLAGIAVLIYLPTASENSAWIGATLPMLGLVAVGGYGFWTGIRRAQWASQFKKVVGCSPWSKEIEELRARGNGHDTADI